MTFREGGASKTRDVSRLLTGAWAPSASTWKTSDVMGGRGVKHNVKMTLFSAKIVCLA